MSFFHVSPSSLSVGLPYVMVDLGGQPNTLRERTSTEELCPLDWPVGRSVGHFLDCIFMWECPATVDRTILRQGVLGCI